MQTIRKKLRITERRKRQKTFHTIMKVFFEENFEPTEEKSSYKYKVQSKLYGELLATIHTESSLESESEVYSVYTRFENPEKVVKIIPNVNPFSGKWNFHEFVTAEPEDFANYVINVISANILD